MKTLGPFKCSKCGCTKYPIQEPYYDPEVQEVQKYLVTGWRMECLGINEGLDCYHVSPYYVLEEDAVKYGTAYLEGKFVE